MSSLRQKQIGSLKHMLNLNSGSSSISSDTVFSVLIYDRHGQDILSPLLSVKDLRQLGVTLHLYLHSERGEVPDVPSIYFCQPTEENLIRISQDFAAGLYTSYYLNFTSPISRQKMEDLAQASLQFNCETSIKKVYDQYINFICLEEDMFCLKHQGSESLSYYALNRANVTDTEIDAMINYVVDGLFSVFVNMGQVPIIRSQKGNAAEMIAQKLDKKLRENLRDARNSFFTGIGTDAFTSGQFSFHRPLLLLMDRNVDLATPLHHTWTYQALTHDLLNLSLNRIALANDSNSKGKKEFEFNDDDLFWKTHKGDPFPMVAAAVETELEDYKSSEEKIKGLKNDIGSDQQEDFLSDNTAILTSAITSLPELLKRKAKIDKHMSVAMALLDCIKERKLDVYFETEEKVMGRTVLEKPLIEFIKDVEMGSIKDKIRLFLIHYLCSANEITEKDCEQFLDALKQLELDLANAENNSDFNNVDVGKKYLSESSSKALVYVKRWKSLMKMTSTATSEYTGGVAKTVSMFSKLMNQGSAIVVEGVKNFVLKENKLPITRITDNLMELRSCDEDKDFTYFDPKIIRPGDVAASGARSKTPFQEAVVFMVGGGNYVEYTNLATYARGKSTNSKRVIYGCTDIVNPEQFLEQLEKLGASII